MTLNASESPADARAEGHPPSEDAPPAPINPADLFGTPRRPDFFCIGSEKAGTTWLWKCLLAHPHVGVPASKELRYFSAPPQPDFLHFRALRGLLDNPRGVPLNPHFMERIATEVRLFFGGEPAYLRIFGQLDAPCVGELTPQYCLLPPERVAEIRRVAPEARILYLLRDPVERMLSGARMVLRVTGQAFDDEALREAALHPTQVALSNAPVHLAKYEAEFGAERVRVFFYDDIATRPAQLLREICDFLSTTPADVPEAVLREVVNKGAAHTPGDALRAELYAKLAPIYDQLERRFPRRVAAWRARHAT